MGDLVCDDCGTINSEDRDVCGLCGESLSEERARGRASSWLLALSMALLATLVLGVLPGMLLEYLLSDVTVQGAGLAGYYDAWRRAASGGFWRTYLAIYGFLTIVARLFIFTDSGGMAAVSFPRRRMLWQLNLLLMPMGIVGGLWFRFFTLTVGLDRQS